MLRVRYFLNDDGGWITLSGDADVFAVVPGGYREVSEAEYNAAAGVVLAVFRADEEG